MKSHRNNIILIIVLTCLSALIYFLQYEVFHQTQNTLFYFLQDLAFVPIQVLMVTLILNRFLNVLERQKKIKKTNVIISTYFSEAGITILNEMAQFNRTPIHLIPLIGKKKNDKAIKELVFDMYAEPSRLEGLCEVLGRYKEFTLNMLENDNLLEHDSFTDMLWAVFHVGDELQLRKVGTCPLDEGDISHISIDIMRAYSAIVVEWLNYMGYLKREYPFLYAIAIRRIHTKERIDL